MAIEHDDYDNPMEAYLDSLIVDMEGGMVPIQVVWSPGLAQGAGLLRQGPVSGTYELCYKAEGSGLPSGGGMISDVFTADAISRVLKQVEMPDSVVQPEGAGRIVMPGGN